MAVLHAYQWLVVVGSLAAFAFGWGTGSNDLANAFATSIGSRALTLKQAVIIASIFEFGGALLLGRVNTNVIAGGIANISAFQQTPEIYAYGMVCALAVGFVWQGLASYLEVNVSATHSIVGAIMGFALVHAGKDGVVWAQRDPGSFPPYKGVVAIIMSWFMSPVLSGAAAAAIFASVRSLVLRRQRAYHLTFFLLPPLVAFTVFVNMYFVFTKGAKKLLDTNDNWPDSKSAWIAAVIAVGMFFITAAVFMPLLKWHTNKRYDAEGKAIVTEEALAAKAEAGAAEALEIDRKRTWLVKAKDLAMHGMNVDIHAAIEADQQTHAMHERAEVYPPHVEYAFSYLQVFSACCVMLAHGAGEVGYMAGPLATIWNVYLTGSLTKTVKPTVWILLICAFGLVAGLATYGYNVTRAMGVRLAKLSPSRGFAAELATAGVITVAAQYGLPTSSSQCITGAIVGVGLLEGVKGVNWIVFLRQFVSWSCTLLAVGLITAALFAQGVYSPSEIDADAVIAYEQGINNLTSTVLGQYNDTLYAFEFAAGIGSLPRLDQQTWDQLNASIATMSAIVQQNMNATVQGTVTPQATMLQLSSALELLQQYAINTLGQTDVYPGVNLCVDANSLTAASGGGAPCKGLNFSGSSIASG